MKALLFLLSLLIAQGGISVVVPVKVSGRITVDDGSAVPTVTTFRGPNIMFGLDVRLPGGAHISDALTQADGSFVATIPTASGIGEFSIVPIRIPLGYYVKSIQSGIVDLRRASLAIHRDRPPEEIRIVLTRTAPEGTSAGVKVSGRVTKLENAGATPLRIGVQSTSAETYVLRWQSIPINADGTFEFNGVPADHYLVQTQANTGTLTTLRELNVAAQDVTGLELELSTPGTQSILIISNPQPRRPEGRGSPYDVAQVKTTPMPPAGSAIVAVSQSRTVSGRSYRHGTASIFDIEQAGTFIAEKRLEDSALQFTLRPGTYDLRGYFRACNENCGYFGSPEVSCTSTLTVTAGQVLYAERIIQGDICTILLSSPTPR